MQIRTLLSLLILALPGVASAQTSGSASLHDMLAQLYNDMMPQSRDLIATGQCLAGFGALWYIGFRVWRHLARAEAIDFFPLLRPFTIGIAIALFPSLMALVNDVLSPLVSGTAQMQQKTTDAIQELLRQKEEALKGTADYQMYVGPDGNGNEQIWAAANGVTTSLNPITQLTASFQFAIAKAYYNMKNQIKVWLSEILQLLFEAASLCIDTLSTFNRVVLTILGPIVLGLSVFPGLEASLAGWFARYVNVYLWLPVANIFSAIIGNIQVGMLKIDINQIQQNGSTFFSSTDVGYLLFLLLGIAGYFTVPAVAGYIVHVSHGSQNGSLARKIQQLPGMLIKGLSK